jgi:response regulator RpfG family c-di-GMP phosphodiesterase
MYAAILIDLQMPRMDGLEATRHIRQIARHATTPIIAMTASVFEEDRKDCIEAGMNDLVSKPVDPALLARVLARWAPVADPATPGQTAASATAAGSAMPDLPGEARMQLRELQRLLAADDIAAREFYHALPPGWVARCGSELGRAIDEFDYEKAGRLITLLLEEPDTQATRA